MNTRRVEQEKLWEIRAKQYNELQWANEKNYLNYNFGFWVFGAIFASIMILFVWKYELNYV